MPGSDKSSLAGTLGAYAAKNTARFHMPGHKGRGLAGFWRQELARWDVTEISGTDNLHSPEGAILEAERAASKSFGSEYTIFLVNGSTAGVVAMMMLAKERGSILVDRECHSSAISGAALADAEIAFIQPRIHKKLGRPGVISAEDLDEALTRTGARSVLITSPNYYGLCADLPALSAVAQKHGAWLMVDAAHGAHFPFSDQLPASPAGYADIWVNSAHKTLNALNQAALLHLGKGVSLPRARQMLAMVETTSPSYLIMASLDWARYCAEAPGVWDRQVERVMRLRGRIDALPGLKVFYTDAVGEAGVADMDPTRIAVDVRGRGVTGFAAAKFLEECGVVAEMAERNAVILITSPADPKEWYDRLVDALAALPMGDAEFELPEVLALPARRMTTREAVFAPCEYIPLREAKGHTVARSIGLYPPGSAVVAPGEVLGEEQLAYLTRGEAEGGELFGLADGSVCCVGSVSGAE